MSEKALSVFIDESGDFGSYENHTPYYLVSMILHNQSVDISENVAALETHLRNLGYPQHTIHTGPLIRRESVYKNDLMERRKGLFNALFNFARRLDIHYISASVKKSECSDVVELTAKLSKAIASAINSQTELFSHFDRIIIYYDNGQVELTKILTSVFTTLLPHVEFRKVRPVDYKLFQVADLVCTMELLSLKAELHSFTKSEAEFFVSSRDFKKNYMKYIQKKKLR